MPLPLVTFCILIAAASLLGGMLPNFIKLRHRETQMVLSLVAGVMLGVALLHLLPHSFQLLGDTKQSLQAALIGLLFMFFLMRMFHFHIHDTPDHEHHDCDHHDHEMEIRRTDIGWVGLAFGFAIHTILDGITLASKVGASHEEASWTLGLGTFLAILLHKPLDAWAIGSLMAAKGWDRKKRSMVNILFALMCPLGAILFYYGVSSFADSRDFIFGISLAFSAGIFLCVSLSDLLPEVHFHSHDRLALSSMLLFGVAIAYGLSILG